jgi:hypothetical protein
MKKSGIKRFILYFGKRPAAALLPSPYVVSGLCPTACLAHCK